MNKSKKYRAITLTEIMAVVLTGGIFFGIGLPFLVAEREDARRSQCAENLHRLAMAVRQYSEAHASTLPVGMTTTNKKGVAPGETFSWHSRLLPFLEEASLYETLDFGKRLMSPEHHRYRTALLEQHLCPADRTAVSEVDSTERATRRSNYVGNFGNTNFGQNDCAGWQGRTPYRFGGAPFAWNRAVPLDEILDGESNTVLFSEVVVNPHETGDRGDYGLAIRSAGAGFTSYNAPNTIETTDSGRKSWDADDFVPAFPNYASGNPLTATLPARSQHPGGVNVVMIDGAVRFVPNSVELAVWHDLTSTTDHSAKILRAETFDERRVIDWIYQDYGKRVADCFTSNDSFEIEAKMVEKVLGELVEMGTEESVITELSAERTRRIDEKKPGSDSAWKGLYLRACQIRRTERLLPVVEEAPEIVYAKHYLMGGSHYTYTEDTTDPTFYDVSPDRRGGSSLWKMTVNADGTVQHALLVETETGVIRDPDVSFDGRRVLFSMRDNLTEDDFGLREYDLETGNTRQITSPKGFADYEPIYLSNENILFVSSRPMRISDCWRTEISNLFTCDTEGRYLRQIGFDQVTTNYPKLLNDSRIIYTRWEYQDRGQIFPQPLFTMNPDGTGQTEYYGNNSFFPTTILHARGIPNSSKVIAIGTGHHTRQRGKLILVDRNRGTQEATGVEYVAPRSEAIAEQVDYALQGGAQFQYPYALDESNYLVGYIPEGVPSESPLDPPFGIYWMADDGRRELLAWDRTISCCQPIPLAKREIKAVRPSSVDYDQATGRFYVQDVYEGPGLAGVERGTIRKLRVVEVLFNRVCSIGGNTNKGPAGGAFVPTPVAVGNGAWDSKRVLGEVPVEADGSAYFEVPAETPVYFQLLDEKDRLVQTMRSWSTLMPGEFFACVGCHESKENTPIAPPTPDSVRGLALAKPPVSMIPPIPPVVGPHQDAGFSYIRDVQPILDRHCVECHDDRPDLEGHAEPSLLGDRYDPSKGPFSIENPSRSFSVSYINLTEGGNQNRLVNWLNMQSAPPMLPPYDSGSNKSELISMFDSPDEAHKTVKLSPEEVKIFATWIDLAVPFCGFPTEANEWNDEEKATWDYYSMKQKTQADLLRKNVRKWADFQAGRSEGMKPSEIVEFTFGGAEAKREFLQHWPDRPIPFFHKKAGGNSPQNSDTSLYRNLAFNPEATWELSSYPSITSNSENTYAAESLAINAIDGRTDEKAWCPGLKTDAELRIDFGEPVEIDRIVLSLLAETPWTSAVLHFDDGTVENLSFRPTPEPQEFPFNKKITRTMKIDHFEQPRPLRFGGISVIEVWGKSR